MGNETEEERLERIDWTQIEPAAHGCISGTLDEWPALNQALRRRGLLFPSDTPAAVLRPVCKALYDQRQADIEAGTVRVYNFTPAAQVRMHIHRMFHARQSILDMHEGWRAPHAYTDAKYELEIIEAGSTGIHTGYCDPDGNYFVYDDEGPLDTIPVLVRRLEERQDHEY